MKPKRSPQHNRQEDLFRSELSQIIDPRDPLVKPSRLARINVGTTVREKNIRFPTDARLYDRARVRLVTAARKRGIVLRQSYSGNPSCQQRSDESLLRRNAGGRRRGTEVRYAGGKKNGRRIARRDRH